MDPETELCVAASPRAPRVAVFRPYPTENHFEMVREYGGELYSFKGYFVRHYLMSIIDFSWHVTSIIMFLFIRTLVRETVADPCGPRSRRPTSELWPTRRSRS